MCFSDEQISQATQAQETTRIDANNTTDSTPKYSPHKFKFVLSKVYTNRLLASLRYNVVVIKDVLDCWLNDNDDQKSARIYIHSSWRDPHVLSLCQRMMTGVPCGIWTKWAACIQVRHGTHPASWGITDMARHASSPCMIRNIFS